jgi:uroporphyrinogen-III decarboxylase
MTSKERFLAALENKVPDRLPVTTHHVMPYFLKKYMNNIHYLEFFDYFQLDPILWISAHKPDESKGEYYDPNQGKLGFLEPRRICTDNWRIELEDIPDQQYKTVRYNIVTPAKTLTMVTQSNEYTSWVLERLIKSKSDIELIAKYAPVPKCDVEQVNREADKFGEQGIVRGFIAFFDIYGQSGCWQDAAILYGVENLIIASFEDPEWVHSFLKIMCRRKKKNIESMKDAKFDIIEHGGGDASTTVISPKIFDDFVAPYDAELITIAHNVGQRVVYHTCGGMMPILENIAAMKPDAMETFTPPGLGGDTDLGEAKKRIGDKLCMIGGFDQFHYFKDCSPEETRQAVRKNFEQAGKGGGFILAPSDHFFDAEIELIRAFADEARKCIYL